MTRLELQNHFKHAEFFFCETLGLMTVFDIRELRRSGIMSREQQEKLRDATKSEVENFINETVESMK